jgi:hypothetical protein
VALAGQGPEELLHFLLLQLLGLHLLEVVLLLQVEPQQVVELAEELQRQLVAVPVIVQAEPQQVELVVQPQEAGLELLLVEPQEAQERTEC